MAYGQNDDARRYEEQRREQQRQADEARRYEDQRRQEQQRGDDARREERKRYDQQKADDDRRYWERKQQNQQLIQAYADRKEQQNAEKDDESRQSQEDADRKHQESEDAYHQNLKQQGQLRAQENERFEQQQRQQRQISANDYSHPWVDSIPELFKLGLFCFVVWALWTGFGKLWVFTQQWQAYDIPLRWVGYFYRAILDIPQNATTNLINANMHFAVQIDNSKILIIVAGVIAVIVVLLVLIMLATSKLARWLFGIVAFVFLTPALLGGLWLGLPHESAANVRAWIKSQPFYTTQLNGAEIDISVVALADWLACSTYQQPTFLADAVNTLVRGKVLIPLPVREQSPSDQRPRVFVYKPFDANFSLAGQTVHQIRVVEKAKSKSLEVDFVGKPLRVAAVNPQYRLPVVFYPDGPEGEKFEYTFGYSGYRSSPRGRVVGYQNILRVDKSGFTVRCSQ